MNAEIIEFKGNQPFRVKVQRITRSSIHWHEGITEILVPIRGDVEVIVNFEHITVKEGDFHFINNRSIHSIRSSSNAVVVMIYVNLSAYEKQFELIKYMFFRSNPFFDDRIEPEKDMFDFKTDYKVHFRNLLIDILLRKLSYELSGKALEIMGNQLIYSMVFEFNWLKFMKSKSLIHPTQFDRYHRIVKYIDEHYADKITLDDIVSSEFITKTYFSHYWKDFSSYSFTERVNYDRVLKSEFLLLTGSNILKISEQCGFSDVKYYYRNFKKWYHCMPLEHRKRCFNYMKLGVDFEELELIYYNSEIQEYANKYLFIECNLNEGMTDSSYIDSYMKMKLLSNPIHLITSAEKYVILNPFKPSNLFTEENDVMVFNWHNIDLSVNITMDAGFLLYLSIPSDSLASPFVHEAIEQFLDGCINRYGLHLMKKWHFFINYKNIQSFDKKIAIEELIINKVPGAKISYSFEF